MPATTIALIDAIYPSGKTIAYDDYVAKNLESDVLAQDDSGRPMSQKIGIMAESSTAASTLARDLNLPLVSENGTGPFRYLLVRTAERLELRDNYSRRTQPFYVDLSSLHTPEASSNLSRRQPLARAMGKQTRSVVDATAGLGQDAFLLTCMGYSVTAIERSPIIAALLRDALSRANTDERLCSALGGRLSVVTGDARDVLPTIEPRPDVVYLDPMFPPKRKRSALARKALRMLRDLVGDDEDAMDLLIVCRRYASNRVVVKRPHHAPPILANPSASYAGKLVRYDIYLPKA